MTIFQVGAACFALFMIYVVSIHSKKKTLSLTEQSLWYTMWAVFIVISIFPHWLVGIAGLLRFARVFDLLLVLALMVLSVVIFLSYFAQKEATQKLEKFVRDKAISEALTKTAKKKVKRASSLRKSKAAHRSSVRTKKK